MTFQVEITPIAEAQIEQAYRWYRERNLEIRKVANPPQKYRMLNIDPLNIKEPEIDNQYQPTVKPFI